MKIFFFDKQEKSAAGGMGTYSKETINALVRKKIQVIPLRFGDKISPSDPPNTVLLSYSLGNKALYFLPKPEALKIIKETFEKEKPDLIHLNLGLSPLDFYLPKLAHKKGVPAVGVFHTGFPQNQKITLGSIGVKSAFISYFPCFSQLDKLLVFSSSVKEFLVSLGLKNEKIEIFPNSVDCKNYSPGKSSFKKKNKIKFAFLFLGRINKDKNPDILIESFLKTKPPPEFKLILVGEGTMGSLYSELQENYKNHSQIIFTGPKLDLKEKIDIIRAADVFVLPSFFEGMSFALLEAMACGLAPVVSDAGNHEEVVGNSGIVIEHNKIKDQLPIALQIFVKNPNLAKILGKKAREKVVKSYNQKVQIEKLIKIYQKVILERKNQKPKPDFLVSLSKGIQKFFT